jgi:hypothetical protein
VNYWEGLTFATRGTLKSFGICLACIGGVFEVASAAGTAGGLFRVASNLILVILFNQTILPDG